MGGSLTDVARKAGVSLSLVSRFVNNDPTLRIREEKRSRILEAMDEVGGLQSRRLRQLAYNVVVPVNMVYSSQDWFMSRHWTMPFWKSLSEALKERDFRCSVQFFDEEHTREFIEDLAAAKGFCDGVMFGKSVVDADLVTLLHRYRLPHVVATDFRAETFDVNTVCDDLADGMGTAVKYLADLGHRRIGYIGRWDGDIISILRQVAAGLDRPMDVQVYEVSKPRWYDNPGLWREETIRAFKAYLAQPFETTALVCERDTVALAVMDVMSEMHLTPGKDISVVSYENENELPPRDDNVSRLTRIESATETVGRRTADLLLDQVIDGRRAIVHERVPTRLIVGETTGVCAQAV